MSDGSGLRIYFDTSVLSALHDDRVADRQALTLEFWARRSTYALATSELTRAELAATPDDARRSVLLGALAGFTIHPVNDAMHALARRYLDAGAFQAAMYSDALHVAAAVLTRQDVLVSWNFKHLVNRRRRAQVNQVNVTGGLSAIDIVAPPEV